MTHTFSSTHRLAPRRARPALHPVALATLLALSGTSVATHAQTAPAPAAAADAAPSLPPVTVSASGLQLGVGDMT
ncbi:MAG TPA: TonB-dependent receptor, partial [Acidovorax sp.]|nr:TonB-dependent receptor [Acidovorax sp.]